MWSNGYIGIPYLDGGRDRYGCDCWGLVRLVLKEQYGKALPALSYSPGDKAEIAALIDTTKPLVAAVKIESPEAGDVLLMLVHGLPNHVGVMVDSHSVLHVTKGTLSRVERIDNVSIRSRIEGFYRVG